MVIDISIFSKKVEKNIHIVMVVVLQSKICTVHKKSLRVLVSVIKIWRITIICLTVIHYICIYTVVVCLLTAKK